MQIEDIFQDYISDTLRITYDVKEYKGRIVILFETNDFKCTMEPTLLDIRTFSENVYIVDDYVTITFAPLMEGRGT